MDEFGGPLIRGRPALTHETVQSWFINARLKAPSIEAVTPLTEAINHLDLFQAFWSDKPEHRAWRNNAPSSLKHKSLAKAIDTICFVLPSLIDEAEAFRPDGDYQGYKNLLSSAQYCLPAFEHLLCKKRGRDCQIWHRVARNLKDLFIEAMRTTAGTRCAGFGKPTSLGIPLLRLAFQHLGLHTSDEQIVDALRPPRKRVRRGNR